MKFLRAIKGITRRDRVRNEIVREELKIEPILKHIERSQLKWFGHVCRMNDKRQVKTIWQTKATGTRRRGRPRKTWNDEVAAILKKKNTNWAQARRMATDKKEWTKFVYLDDI